MCSCIFLVFQSNNTKKQSSRSHTQEVMEAFSIQPGAQLGNRTTTVTQKRAPQSLASKLAQSTPQKVEEVLVCAEIMAPHASSVQIQRDTESGARGLHTPSAASSSGSSDPGDVDDLAASPTHSFWSLAKDFQWQLITVNIIMANEAVSATLPMPFVGLFVAHLGHQSVDEAGYTSGFLIAMFFLGQMLSGPIWGKASDRYGRRPTLQLGLLLNALLVLMFGLSSTVYGAVAVRFLQGMANGNVIVAKTITGDITDETTEHIGFAALSLFWGIGSIFGPVLGGVLYDPSKQRVWSFINWHFDSIFVVYPALLPSAALALVSIGSLVWITRHLDETGKKSFVSPRGVSHHPSAVSPEFLAFLESSFLTSWIAPLLRPRHHNEGGAHRSISIFSPVDDDSCIDFPPAAGCVSDDRLTASQPHQAQCNIEEAQPPAPAVPSFGIVDAFRCRETRNALVLYMCISATENGMMEIFPLWAIASRDVGGLHFSSSTIGSMLMIAAFFCVIANLVFDKIAGFVRKNDSLMWDISVTSWVFTIVLHPLATNFHMTDTNAYWYNTFLASFREFGLSWAFSLSFLMVAKCAPKEHMGAMSGIGQSCGSLARMTSLLCVPPIFAWSLEGKKAFPLNFHLAFWVVAIPLVVSLFITKSFKTSSR